MVDRLFFQGGLEGSRIEENFDGISLFLITIA